MKKALITGISGQDGSYLAELLLTKGYEVHGMIRRHSTPSTQRIDHIFKDLQLHYGDVTEINSCISVLREADFDEVYNLASQSHVRTSFDVPLYTAEATGIGALNMLEAVRGDAPEYVRFYQASSSELYGKVQGSPQHEHTPFYPRSPYGCAKAFAYYATVNYRESYNMFASNGILFNHESPRRGETFVTKKIVKAAVNIHRRKQDVLYLGNLDAKRDWGHATDYVEAMWLMLQHWRPDDFVIATGESRSVREFLSLAFSYVGLNWQDYVKIDPRLVRPTEVDELLGNPAKAKSALGWKPKFKFADLVKDMMEAELNGKY